MLLVNDTEESPPQEKSNQGKRYQPAVAAWKDVQVKVALHAVQAGTAAVVSQRP